MGELLVPVLEDSDQVNHQIQEGEPAFIRRLAPFLFCCHVAAVGPVLTGQKSRPVLDLAGKLVPLFGSTKGKLQNLSA
jgi:hypothetical protein